MWKMENGECRMETKTGTISKRLARRHSVLGAWCLVCLALVRPENWNEGRVAHSNERKRVEMGYARYVLARMAGRYS